MGSGGGEEERGERGGEKRQKERKRDVSCV
jgi:hypothetical protein